MGKVRIKSFDETENSEALAKKKAKREAKKAQKAQEINENDSIEANLEEVESEVSAKQEDTDKEEVSEIKEKKSKKEKFTKKKFTSKRFTENRKLVSKTQTYPLDKAVSLLTQFKIGKFDESVELHVNVKEQGTSGTLNLPHGSGKSLRIKIADDALLSSIQSGKTDFDVLIASPDMMPKLAKVARILGPKGLMPNPKNGTVTTNPDEAVKRFSGGEIRFKTEAKSPVIHLLIGKVSFGEEKIMENAKTALDAIGENKIKSATLTSTMSPGIKLSLSSL